MFQSGVQTLTKIKQLTNKGKLCNELHKKQKGI